MNDRDKRTEDRAEEVDQQLAIGKDEREMESTQRELAREMDELKATEERAERDIEQEWRTENFGQDPERPARWKNHEP